MSYTIDSSSINVALCATIPPTDYIALGFAHASMMSQEPLMAGLDLVFGMNGAVTAFAAMGTTVASITSNPKPSGYISWQSYDYNTGVARMRFTRSLAAPQGKATAAINAVPMNICRSNTIPSFGICSWRC